MEKKEMEQTQEERYLERIFCLLHKQDNIRFTEKNGLFNQTEVRLLGEIVSAKKRGARYISTQLAKRIGITRSAVSQIVNNLESKGVVKRVPDKVDRKIAYVEIADDFMENYGDFLHRYSSSVYEVIQTFGEEKFETLCDYLEEFFKVTEQIVKGRKG